MSLGSLRSITSQKESGLLRRQAVESLLGGSAPIMDGLYRAPSARCFATVHAIAARTSQRSRPSPGRGLLRGLISACVQRLRACPQPSFCTQTESCSVLVRSLMPAPVHIPRRDRLSCALDFPFSLRFHRTLPISDRSSLMFPLSCSPYPVRH